MEAGVNEGEAEVLAADAWQSHTKQSRFYPKSKAVTEELKSRGMRC